MTQTIDLVQLAYTHANYSYHGVHEFDDDGLQKFVHALMSTSEEELSTLRAKVAGLTKQLKSEIEMASAGMRIHLALKSEHAALKAELEEKAKAQAVADADVQKGLERMTAGRASFFMERFLRAEKLLGPNEQAALHYVIAMLDAAAPSQAVPAHLDDAAVDVLAAKAKGGAA